MTDTDGAGWPERFTAGVAGEIKRYREAKGWSFQQLADACTALGYPTLRTTLANLENGRRKSITVHEVLVIAEALGVPGVQLVFPGIPYGECEYLPGKFRSAWQALRWFTGEVPADARADAGDREYHLYLMREIERYRPAANEVGIRLEDAQALVADAERDFADLTAQLENTDEHDRGSLTSALASARVRLAAARTDLARAREHIRARKYLGLILQTLNDAGFTIFEGEDSSNV